MNNLTLPNNNPKAGRMAYRNQFARGFASAISKKEKKAKEKKPAHSVESKESKAKQVEDEFVKKFRTKLELNLANPEKAALVKQRIDDKLNDMMATGEITPEIRNNPNAPEDIVDSVVRGITVDAMSDVMDVEMTVAQKQVVQALRDNPDNYEEIIAKALAAGISPPKINL